MDDSNQSTVTTLSSRGRLLLIVLILLGLLSATDDDVTHLFQTHGEVYSAKVIVDRDTGRSKGFAFVEMDDDAAEKVLASPENFELEGRALRVNEAQDRRPRGSGPPRDRGRFRS